MDFKKLSPYLIYFLSYAATFFIAWYLGRYLKGRGKIRCTISELRIEFHKSKEKENEMPYSKMCNYDEADSGHYNVKLDFFNEKDVQIALRNPSIIFERKNKKKVTTNIKPSTSYFDIAKGFNLPSRELFHCSWLGIIGVEFGKLENALKSNKAFFVGYFPNGKEVKLLILKGPLYNRLDERFRESIGIKK